MKKFSWIAVIALITLLLQSNVDAQVKFAWKLSKDTPLKYELTQSMDMSMKTGDRTVTTTSEHTINMTWKTLEEATAEKPAVLEQTIDQIKFTMNVPGLEQVTYDSADKKEPEGLLGRQIAPMLKGMVGVPFIMNMDTTGKVSDVKIPQSLTELFEKQPGGGFNVMFSNDGMKQLIEQAAVTLPVGEVAVGKDWEKIITVKIPQIGKQEITTKYTYKGKAEENAALDQVDISSNVNIITDKDSAATVAIQNQSSAGKLLFDTTKGVMEESSLEQKVEMELNIKEVKINQSINTKTQLKLLGGMKKAAEPKADETEETEEKKAA